MKTFIVFIVVAMHYYTLSLFTSLFYMVEISSYTYGFRIYFNTH